MTVQITIIGLNRLGLSFGLALSEHKDLIRRVGHDRDPAAARQAEKMGAVDSISFNLPSSVKTADVVLLAEPLDQARQTLELIAPDLKPGAVVMDTGPLKVDSAAVAGRILPEERHFVSLTPTLNPAYFADRAVGPEAAHADLFKNSLMVITAPPGTNSEAIKLASDLTGLLGATPFFGDPYEVDGLLAATVLLPQLAAAALVQATSSQPGWREGLKIADQDYAEVTAPLTRADSGKALALAALGNSANTTRVLDDLIHALGEIRSALANGEHEGLETVIADAAAAREKWLQQRGEARWASEDTPRADIPSSGDMFGKLLFGLRKRPPRPGEKPTEK